MKQSKLFLLLAVLLCATTTGWAQTWLGSGNSADPYLLKSSNEWEALAYTWLDQDGDITAYGNEDDSAGIGSSQYADSPGAIYIYGGLVKAYGGDEAAGIGGGDGIVGAYVTITGGEVRAYGGYNASGIGGGEGADGGAVSISGGIVLAEGNNAAGIGAGNGGSVHNALEIADQWMVQYWNWDKSEYDAAKADYRVDMARSIKVRIVPCTHPGYTADTCPYHKH